MTIFLHWGAFHHGSAAVRPNQQSHRAESAFGHHLSIAYHPKAGFHSARKSHERFFAGGAATRWANPPLFLIHGAGGGILWGYANLAKHLAPDQPVYGIESRGLRGLEEFSRVEEMAGHYIQELRRVQPEGPYYLGGYCFGGIVAYEMARQLRALDQEVAFLA